MARERGRYQYIEEGVVETPKPDTEAPADDEKDKDEAPSGKPVSMPVPPQRAAAPKKD